MKFYQLTELKLLRIKYLNAYKNFSWLRSGIAQNIIRNYLCIVHEILSEPKVNSGRNIVLICMTRDENELFKFWMDHHSSLSTVRAICIVDHSSKIPIALSDFELDVSKSYHLYRFSHNSHLQAHVLNTISKEIAIRYPDSLVLPLDTDEFLPLLESSLIPKSENEIGYLEWRLAWPADLFSITQQAGSEIVLKRIKFLPRSWGGNKHFLSSKMIQSGYRWSQGAHVIYNKYGLRASSHPIGTIIHVPVRSLNQIFLKFSRGDLVHDIEILNSKDNSGNRIVGNHWKITNDVLVDKTKFLKDALSAYYDRPVIGEQETLWENLISGRISTTTEKHSL